MRKRLFTCWVTRGVLRWNFPLWRVRCLGYPKLGATFKPGDKFLAKEQMAGLVLSFDNVGAFDKTHPLPMSECHTVMLDDEGLEPDNGGEQGQT